MIYTIYLLGESDSITETISLDVVNNFGEDYSSSLAQNTVENGYVISDSISLNNPRFSIGGVITDSKFRVEGKLVTYNPLTQAFEYSADSRDTLRQIPDDSLEQIAEKVKARLVSLWENKEVFGIMESRSITNVQGSSVRSIFPCFLTNLSFATNDASNAFYPTMTIERITYAEVKYTTVENPVPELIPKYKDSLAAGNSDTTASSTVKPEDDLKSQIAKGKESVTNQITQENPNPVYKEQRNEMSYRAAQQTATEVALAELKSGDISTGNQVRDRINELTNSIYENTKEK